MRFPRVLATCVACVWAFLAVACRESVSPGNPLLQAALAQPVPREIPHNVWADVRRFYEARLHSPAWSDAHGPNKAATGALETLRNAEAHGLESARYGESQLTAVHNELVAARKDESTDSAHKLAEFDVRLTSALLQLARHVAVGALKPDALDARWNSKREPPDLVAALNKAIVADVADLLTAVQPRHPEYQALQHGLQSLRGQAERGWPLIPASDVRPGQTHASVIPLRQRLAAAGYLPEKASRDSNHFDEDVQFAVRTFQEHHGLKPTGLLDKATLAAMNVPLATRITQVALNLERWRWLPDDLGERHLFVNIPSFHLLARESGKTTLDIRIVVGKRGNETPTFSDTMTHVVFSPYWNIPETIALKETAPAVAQDPAYLERNRMEVVDASGRVVPASSIAWDDEDALRSLSFRQRPGRNNALGHVKFMFPNKHNIYIHDTPADALFARIGRAFSHGCVRVEAPQALAEYVLRDQPEWTPEAIGTAMRAGAEKHVKLTQQIPVHLVYFTAWVDELGGLHFMNDVYNYDVKQARTR